MKSFIEEELKSYLNKISDKNLCAYNVYQIEGEGKNLYKQWGQEYSYGATS